MVNQLSDMEIRQVHLVGSPAIKKKFLIIKSEDGMDELEKAKSKAALAEDAKDGGADDAEEDADGKKKNPFAKSDGSGEDTDTGKLDELTKAANDAIEAKKSVETKLAARDAALIKSALDILKSVDSEVAKSAAESLEEEMEGKKVEKSNKNTADEIASVVKSLMPEIVKAIEEPFKKSNDEMKEQLEDARKSVADLVGEKVTREIDEIAKGLIGDREENTKYLRLMKSKLSAEEFDEVLKREQAKSEQVRKSNLFKESGTAGSFDQGKGDSPYARLTDIANGMIQKSTEKISFQDAFAKAISDNPELYDEYRTNSYANKWED